MRSLNQIGILFVIFIIAIFIRVYIYLLNIPFNFDESVIYYISSKYSLSNLISGNYYAIKFHPPLFYAINHFYASLSNSEIFLRFPSLIYSIISLFVFYKLISITLNGKIAALAILIFSFLPFSLYWSSQYRVYPLLLLLSLLYIYHFELTKKNRIYIYTFMCLGILGFKLDCSFIFTFMVVNTYFILSKHKHFSLFRWEIINTIITLSLVPYILFYSKTTLLTLQSQNINWIPIHGPESLWNSIGELLYSEVYFNSSMINQFIYNLLNIFVLITCLIILYQIFTSFRKYLLYIIILLFPVLLSYIINYFYPVIIGKSIMISSIGIVVLVASFLSESLNRYILIKLIYLILMIISFVAIFLLFNQQPNWNKAQSFFSQKEFKSNSILSFPNYYNKLISFYNKKYQFVGSESQILNEYQGYYTNRDNYESIMGNTNPSICVFYNKYYLTHDLTKEIPENKILSILEKYPDKVSLDHNYYIVCK